MTHDQATIISSNIELRQEISRLNAALERANQERDTVRQLLNAVITAFLRSGAPAVNVTQECWDAEQSYRIVKNGDYATISPSAAEQGRKDRVAWDIIEGEGYFGHRNASMSWNATRRSGIRGRAYRSRCG